MTVVDTTQPGSDTGELARSRAFCRRVTQERARNFYYGLRLTPEPKRSALFALYAWMREADDLADEEGPTESKVEALERFRATSHRILGGNGEPRDDETDDLGESLWPAMQRAQIDHAIPMEYFDAMIDGQLLDQTVRRYQDFDQLYDYCYKVASVVGLACIEIWGYAGGADTRKLSEQRGIAFQLTNILRDVIEDAQRDRVYLPAAECDLHELNPSMFTMRTQPEVLHGIRKLADRAAGYYQASAALESRVHRDGRPCLWAMTKIYQGLLDRIRRDPKRVLSGHRVSLPAWRKALIATRARLMAGR